MLFLKSLYLTGKFLFLVPKCSILGPNTNEAIILIVVTIVNNVVTSQQMQNMFGEFVLENYLEFVLRGKVKVLFKNLKKCNEDECDSQLEL